MFNVGGPEILVIIVVALMILGPEQLPKAMRTFGNVMSEIRKVSGGFQDEMRKAMDTIESSGSDTSADKPMSPKPPSGAPMASPSPRRVDVTEVVARNTDDPGPASSPDGEGSDRPPVDPADRAAG